MDHLSKIYLISGPTASGKTEFAIKLAKKIKGEIINADSMQIYKELKILTARPTNKDKKKCKHHLYGFANVNKKFSVGSWLKLVVKKIDNIRSNKKVPILVGGTGMYFTAITSGLVKIPTVPKKVRNETMKLRTKLGQKKFFSKLIKLDPKIINIINENDAQRSVRAFEVKKYTKRSIIDWYKETKKNYNDDEFIKLYIDYPRADLIKKINKRINLMFKIGAVNEVKKFLRLKVRKEFSPNKVIGINEISGYLSGKLNYDEMKDRIAIKTRQYAKRQSTWARGKMANWQKINPKDLAMFLKKI